MRLKPEIVNETDESLLKIHTSQARLYLFVQYLNMLRNIVFHNIKTHLQYIACTFL